MIDKIIVYEAEWCHSCSKYKPVLEEFRLTNPGIQVIHVDVDKASYPKDVTAVPTTYFLADGRVVKSSVGPHTPFELEALLADANSKAEKMFPRSA